MFLAFYIHYNIALFYTENNFNPEQNLIDENFWILLERDRIYKEVLKPISKQILWKYLYFTVLDVFIKIKINNKNKIGGINEKFSIKFIRTYILN